MKIANFQMKELAFNYSFDLFDEFLNETKDLKGSIKHS